MQFPLTAEILDICHRVRAAGGRALLVGGWVRDALFDHPSKDHDIEVYNLDPETLRSLLLETGRVDTVGKASRYIRYQSRIPITATEWR